MIQRYLAGGLALAALLGGCGGDLEGTEKKTQIPLFISPPMATVEENTVAVLKVSTDDAGAKLSLGGVDASLFDLQSDGMLLFKTAPDYDGTFDSDGGNVYLVTITATDAAGNKAEQILSVTVTDVDDIAPTFTSGDTATMAENTMAVLKVSTDATGVTLSLGGSDAALFELKSGGAVSFKSAPDYENPSDSDGDNVYHLTVTATDMTSNATEQNLSVTVTDTDESGPVFTSPQAVKVAENTKAVLKVSTDDKGAKLSLGGTDRALFKLQKSGAITFKKAPDYEKPTDKNGDNDYRLTLTATNAAGNVGMQILSVRVTDVDEIAPVFTSPRVVKVAENTTAVLKVSTDDKGAKLSLSGTDRALFKLQKSGAIIFKKAPDYEKPTDKNGDNDYRLRLTATNAAGNTAKQKLSVRVTDVMDTSAPIWQDNAAAATVTKPWVLRPNYDAGDYSNTSGDTAATYCSGLALDNHTDWRLPTLEELKSLVDKSKSEPAVDTIKIKNIIPSYYWTSTTNADDPSGAKMIHFAFGYELMHQKRQSHYVRCVRGGE